jgi:hypothetical protein
VKEQQEEEEEEEEIDTDFDIVYATNEDGEFIQETIREEDERKLVAEMRRKKAKRIICSMVLGNVMTTSMHEDDLINLNKDI